MVNIFGYIKALLKRHWASFMFASIIPAIVGLFAVAATTVISSIIYENYMLEDKYYNIFCVRYLDKTEDEIDDDCVRDGRYQFQFDKGSSYWVKLQDYSVIGKCCFGIEGKFFDGLSDELMFVDYGYEQIFPTRIYKGTSFTGEKNEIILDIEYLGKYEIGDVLEINCIGLRQNIENQTYENFNFSVSATVVGFKRTNEYMRKEFGGAKVCLAGGFGYHEFSYLETEYYSMAQEEIFGIFPWLQHFIDTFGKNENTYTVALARLNYKITEVEFNRYVLVLFLFLSLSILIILIDLCLNGSMLKRTERIAVRSGLKNKDIAIAYIIKALLQLLLSTVIMLGMVLYFNHKTGALLIMESLWGGVVTVLFLNFISWSIDCVRLYRSWRIKR